jgi:hypothetical protein
VKRLAKAINPLAKRLGFYTAYQLHPKEFVGVADRRCLRKRLHARGYNRPPRIGCIPLSATKTHPVTGAIHDFTMRKPDPEDNRLQFHIHGFRFDSVVAIASHHELRPDLRRLAGESPADRKQRLKTHYRPVWGDDYIRGKTCQLLEEVLRC